MASATATAAFGITNGDLFTALMAFSPGFNRPATKRGKPRIFICHGRQDQILDINATGRPIVRLLQRDGYDVHYDEFDGPDRLNVDEVRNALRWFVQR